jgi:hypothetical protein
MDYVKPTHELFDKLYKEGAQTLADEALAEEQAAILAEEAAMREEESRGLESIGSEGEASLSSSSSSEGDAGQSTSTTIPPLQTNKSTRRPSVLNFTRKFSTQSSTLQSSTLSRGPSQRKSLALRRRTGLTSEIQLSCATLSIGVETLPVNFAIIRGFFGQTACQNLGMILDGDESLEVKGTKYWSEQLGLLHDTFEKVKEDIRISLDEKRNFFSFILTTVTVGLAPLTILTGYW